MVITVTRNQTLESIDLSSAKILFQIQFTHRLFVDLLIVRIREPPFSVTRTST